MVNSHFPMVEIPFLDISSPWNLPKPKVSINSVSVYWCSPLCKVWWSKANDHGKVTDLFLSKAQKQDSTRFFHKEFGFLWSNVSKMLIDHHHEQIVLLKVWNFDLCLGTNAGTNQAKIEKISISLAIRLGILRSLVSATRCEANKSNLLPRKERPAAAHAV